MQELIEGGDHDEKSERLNQGLGGEKTRFEQKFSSFYFPLMMVVPPVYRSTHSDVMCISNNGVRKDYDKEKSNATSCQLPYEEVYASDHSRKINSKKAGGRNQSIRGRKTRRNSGTTGVRRTKNYLQQHETLLEQKHASDTRKKIDRQLHAEHRQYMAKLKKEREERLAVETKAVTTIQRFVRGFAVRQRLYPHSYKQWHQKKGIVYTEDEIWDILLDATSKIGIHPSESKILGFPLPQKFQKHLIK